MNINFSTLKTALLLTILTLCNKGTLAQFDGGYSNQSSGRNNNSDELVHRLRQKSGGYRSNNYNFSNSYSSNSNRYAKGYCKYPDSLDIIKYIEPADTGVANSWLEFFYNNTDTNHIAVKTVTMQECRSDSMRHKGYEMYKTIISFNRFGQIIQKEIYVDNQVIYRKSLTYNDKNKLIYFMEMSSDDENSKPKKTGETAITYDENGRITRVEESLGGSFDKNSDNTYYKYNKAGRITEKIYYGHNYGYYHAYGSTRDTVITKATYDNNNRLIYKEIRTGGYADKWSGNNLWYYNYAKRYYAYDLNGRPILDAKSSNSDSSTTISSYDDNGTILTENKYNYSMLVTSYSRKPIDNGHFAESFEELSTAAPNQCPNNVITALVVDSNDNVLTKTETRISDGKPIVTTTTHHYQFNEKRQLVTDTSIMISKGHLFSMRSQEVIKYTHTAHGLVTEMNDQSGGDYNTNWKFTCKYDDMDNMTDSSLFSACDEFIPETETQFTYYPGHGYIKERIANAYSKITTYDYTHDLLVSVIFEKPKAVESSNDYGDEFNGYNRYRYREKGKCTLYLYTYELWGK